MSERKTVIVARHPALVRRIYKLGLAPEGTPVLTGKLSEADVKGKHVIGVLPLSLAACAESVTQIPIAWDSPDANPTRWTQLDDAALDKMAGEPVTYRMLTVHDEARAIALKYERERERYERAKKEARERYLSEVRDLAARYGLKEVKVGFEDCAREPRMQWSVLYWFPAWVDVQVPEGRLALGYGADDWDDYIDALRSCGVTILSWEEQV